MMFASARPRTHHLCREQFLPRAVDEVFDFFARAVFAFRYAAVARLLG